MNNNKYFINNYYKIINIYIKFKNIPILIYSPINTEIINLINEISKWILCNNKNIYLKCNNCFICKQNNIKNNFIFEINNLTKIDEIRNIFNKKSIFNDFKKNIILYIKNINIMDNNIINLLIKHIYNINFFYIFITNKIEFINKYLKIKYFLIKINKLYKKKIIKKYKNSNISSKNINIIYRTYYIYNQYIINIYNLKEKNKLIKILSNILDNKNIFILNDIVFNTEYFLLYLSELLLDIIKIKHKSSFIISKNIKFFLKKIFILKNNDILYILNKIYKYIFIIYNNNNFIINKKLLIYDILIIILTKINIYENNRFSLSYKQNFKII